jgi:2-dehydropantoate 2-reductase
MKILVYGAGAIGSFNAARLADGGHDVTLLARGRRLLELREHGVVLENARSGARATTQVRLTEALEPEDAYDLVLVAMRRHQVPAVLPALAANTRTPSVLFLGNNAAGADDYVATLGPERVLLGQANMGGVRVDHVVRYLWARVLPLEFGELDGRRTPRSEAIVAAFRQAGLAARQVRHIDASLKTHAASLLPVVGALYWAKGDVRRVAHSRAALRLWVRATREAQRALRRVGVPIVPAANRVLYEWVPERLLAFAMGRFLDTDFAAAGLADADAEGAPGEMKELVDEFRAILLRAGEPAPACERLYAFVDARWEKARTEESAGAGAVTPNRAAGAG